MSSSGQGAKRISFGEGSYSTPVWSPRGDIIAFTKLGRGSFAIGIMKPDGSGERILTEGFHNEGPTFAPNGRVRDVLPRSGRQRRALALYGGHHRPQRAAGSDPGLCIGPGLVAAADVDLSGNLGSGSNRHKADTFTPH